MSDQLISWAEGWTWTNDQGISIPIINRLYASITKTCLYLLCQLSYLCKSILSLERDFRGHADQSTLRWTFSSSDIKSHYIILVPPRNYDILQTIVLPFELRWHFKICVLRILHISADIKSRFSQCSSRQYLANFPALPGVLANRLAQVLLNYTNICFYSYFPHILTISDILNTL